jgi:hypothetical protein
VTTAKKEGPSGNKPLEAQKKVMSGEKIFGVTSQQSAKGIHRKSISQSHIQAFSLSNTLEQPTSSQKKVSNKKKPVVKRSFREDDKSP